MATIDGHPIEQTTIPVTELDTKLVFKHEGVLSDFYNNLEIFVNYPTAEAASNPSVSETATAVIKGMLEGMSQIQSLGDRRLDLTKDDPFPLAAAAVPGVLIQSSLFKPDYRYTAILPYIDLMQRVPAEVDKVRRNLTPQLNATKGKRSATTNFIVPEEPGIDTLGTGEIKTANLDEATELAFSFITMAGIGGQLMDGRNVKASMIKDMAERLGAKPYDPGRRAVGILKDLAVTSELRRALSGIGITAEDVYHSSLALHDQTIGLAKASLLSNVTFMLQVAENAVPHLLLSGMDIQTASSPLLHTHLERQRQPLRTLLDDYVKTGTFDGGTLDELITPAIDTLRAVATLHPSSKLTSEVVELIENEYEMINSTKEARTVIEKITRVPFKPDISHLITITPQSSVTAQQPLAETTEKELTQIVAEVDTTAEQKAALEARHEQLLVALSELREPYQSSSRVLRKEGLHQLLRDLQLGFSDPETEETTLGITAEQSQQIIGLMYGLQQELHSADAAAAQYAVAYTMASEINLVGDIQVTRKELHKFDVNGFTTVNEQLSTNLDWLYANREILPACLQANLPQSVAQRYVALLDTLFMTLEEAPVEILDAPEPKVSVDIPMPEPVVVVEPVPEPIEVVITEPKPEILDEPPEPIAKVLGGLALPLDERDVAIQLDWEVFPADITLNTIRTQTERGLNGKDAASIEWSRIGDLLEVARAYDGVMYRSKPRSLGATIPYFVAEITIDGHTFAIGENPQYGNASYVLRTDLAAYGASWQEIYEQPRQLARLLGAEQVVHTPKRAHLDRIMDVIQSQILVKAP